MTVRVLKSFFALDLVKIPQIVQKTNPSVLGPSDPNRLSNAGLIDGLTMRERPASTHGEGFTMVCALLLISGWSVRLRVDHVAGSRGELLIYPRQGFQEVNSCAHPCGMLPIRCPGMAVLSHYPNSAFSGLRTQISDG